MIENIVVTIRRTNTLSKISASLVKLKTSNPTKIKMSAIFMTKASRKPNPFETIKSVTPPLAKNSNEFPQTPPTGMAPSAECHNR